MAHRLEIKRFAFREESVPGIVRLLNKCAIMKAVSPINQCGHKELLRIPVRQNISLVFAIEKNIDTLGPCWLLKDAYSRVL